MQSFPVINHKIRSQSNTDQSIYDNVMFPKIHERVRQGIHHIAESNNQSRVNGESSFDYDSIIHRSQVLFAATDEDSVFSTAPRISMEQVMQQRNQTMVRRNKQIADPIYDLYSLQNIVHHFGAKVYQSEQKQQNLARSTEKKHKYNVNQLRRFKYLQQQHENRLRISSNILEQAMKPDRPVKSNKIFSHTVTLLVVDYLDSQSPTNAAVGINLEQHHLSTMRKNLRGILDQEIKTLVYPMIQSITKRNEQNKGIPDDVGDRCQLIKSKKEFITYINYLKNEHFQDTLDDVIRYFFIPQPLYRQQIVIDLIEHINNSLNMHLPNVVKREDVQIRTICNIQGVLITDFIQIEWDTKFLICFSSNHIVLQKLPILEQLINNFQTKLKIDYTADVTKIPIGNYKDILRRAVNVLKWDPQRSARDYDVKASVNCFLSRLHISKFEPNVLPETTNAQEGQLSTQIGQVMTAVKSSKGSGLIDIQNRLTKQEIQTLQKEYPGYSTQDMKQILSDFKSLTIQNDYYEIRNGLDMTKKIDVKLKKMTYLNLFIEQQTQLQKLTVDGLQKVFQAAEINLSPENHNVLIDCDQYVKLRALLCGNVNEKFTGRFLKNYFDPTDQRSLPTSEVDDIISKILSKSFPETFRFMFQQLVKNWFKEMKFYRDDKFDCSFFPIAATQDFVLMKYIIQWIVGFYEQDLEKK